MTRILAPALGSALSSLLLFGAISAAAAAPDLSRYRDFQFGSDLLTVAKQAGSTSTETKTIHRRPALLQELAWRPQPLGWSSKTESVQDVVFSFYAGELYQIVVNYDRAETEGLTSADLVEAISASYGLSSPLTAPAKAALSSLSDQEEAIARWQDARFRFELIRSSYGPSFRLVGVELRLEKAADTAILAATRLDVQEAPQRDAARLALEAETANAKLEKARLVNKQKFRP